MLDVLGDVTGGIRLWLLGAAVSGSPSPAMHQAALRALGVAGSYAAVEVDAEGFDAAVARMRAGEARGANVTIPHKRRAAAAADELEGDAALLGAVNTLVAIGPRLVGANTDAAGLEHALRAQGLWPAPGSDPRSVALVLGAGGAAAAAVLVMARAGAGRVVLAGRRPDAAMVAAAALGRSLGAAGFTSAIEAVAMTEAAEVVDGAAWIVNATPAGAGGLPVDLRRAPPSAVVVDLRYRPRPVDLVAAATAVGLRATDGLEMLLAQGMLSLRRWTGLEPPWEVARAALLRAVAA